MDVAHPYTALCPTLDSGVLSVLAGTTRPLTGREVARLLGRPSHSGVLNVLNRLSEHGLVDRREAGRALLFTLNREHLAAPAVAVLADMRLELFDRLRAAIGALQIAPVHVSVFGSTARGEGSIHSDIDLFVVRPSEVDDDDPRWREQLDLLARQVQRWTGNRAGIAETAETEIEQLRTDAPPIVAELRADAITLTGPDIATMLSRA
ncbi:MAG: nucleotidyltransferase domain-containing protein [Solirubrobacteraceae bacterium]